MGVDNRSAIGKLVERVTRDTLLFKPDFQDSDYTYISFGNPINN